MSRLAQRRPRGRALRIPIRRLRAVLAAALATSVAAGGVALTAPAATAALGSEDFKAGLPYTGDFPDPDIRKFGDTYYAYATTISSKNLPVMTSKDLRTWIPRDSYTGDNRQWWDNDAMPVAGPWTYMEYRNDGWRSRTWAPSVARVNNGEYVAAYSAQMAAEYKWCISLARSASPVGPFVDTTTAPLVCPPDQGVIDPQIFVEGSKQFLLWKTEGIKGSTPTKLWVQRLNWRATGFRPGSKPKELLRTARHTWEGNVIENPAMVKKGKRYYLFYSGNRYSTADYAVGYAICKTVKGPCERRTKKPLLKTGGKVAGPGGGTPFKAGGKLRLGYAAWQIGRVGYPTSEACEATPEGCNQRRLYVATLKVKPRSKGKLVVTNRG